MATVTLPTPSTLPEESSSWSLADLREHLDGVPAERIRLFPYPGTATEDDVFRIQATEDRLCELIDGVLVEKPMGWYEARLATLIGYFLEMYQNSNDLGFVVGADGPVRLRIGRLRMPDISFLLWSRFPGRILPKSRVLKMAPDLAVEVLSKSNTRREMARKLGEYFAAGAKLVWIVDPKKRTARIHTSPETFVAIDETGELDGGEVLPGFRLSLAELFTRAGEQGKVEEADEA